MLKDERKPEALKEIFKTIVDSGEPKYVAPELLEYGKHVLPSEEVIKQLVPFFENISHTDKENLFF